MKSVPRTPREPSQDGRVPPPAQTFDEIYDQNFAFVWRCLRGLGIHASALDDAAQDVFLVVHRQLAGFRGESSPRTWLFAIARNVAANHQRRARRKQGPLESMEEEPAHVAPGPHEHAEDAQAAAFLADFLAHLDAKKRELFILAVLEELTMPEAAAALSIPLNTAYTRLRRARAAFEKALERRAP